MTASETGRETLTPDAARAFCRDLGDTVDALIRVLDEETGLVRAARLSDAAALGDAKSAVAGRYMQAHAVLRTGGPQLASLVPDEVGHLRGRQQALESAISQNLAVLATARTVSETLIREAAEIVTRRRGTVSTYGADARHDAQPARTGPITCNVAL